MIRSHMQTGSMLQNMIFWTPRHLSGHPAESHALTACSCYTNTESEIHPCALGPAGYLTGITDVRIRSVIKCIIQR